MEQVENGSWTPIKAGKNGPQISHLMFADDLLLFGKATEENMHCVINTLETFCSISGQMVNLEKTSIFFSKNVPRRMRARLARISGFKICASMGKYLGVPLLGKCPRQGDFNFLIDKVRDKLSGWKAKHLSFAGRVTLSKSVIQAIPIYTMMTTPVPKSCLAEIQRLQRGFIWGDTDDKKRMHMVSWNTLTLPKGYGGLGIRDLIRMNKACIMKLAWGVRTDPDRLWYRVLDGKYGRGTLVDGNLQVKITDSPLWKAIHSCWHDISSYEAWSLGNGTSINFWRDKWINESLRLIEHAPHIPPTLEDWRVTDAVNDDGLWDLSLVNHLLPPHVLNKILAILPPLPHDRPDVKYWPGGGSGDFSVALAYSFISLHDSTLIDDKWKRVWRLQVPERVRCFIWQILHRKLATRAYCGSWGNGDLMCPLCRRDHETIIHVMRDCCYSVALWNALMPTNLRMVFYGAELDLWLLGNLCNNSIVDGSLCWSDVWATGCYNLWFWRNKQLHDDDFERPSCPARAILQQSHEYAAGSLSPMRSRHVQQVQVVWRAPPTGWYVLNTDGAVKSEPGVAGCGGVLRDANGVWVSGFAKRLFVTTAYLAELWGVLEGIRLAINKGSTYLEIQMDSSTIVNCLNGNDSGSIAGRQLMRRIKQLIATISNVRIIHIYREANRVADALATMGCNQDDDLIMFSSPPPNVKLLADADVSGVSTPRLIPV